MPLTIEFPIKELEFLRTEIEKRYKEEHTASHALKRNSYEGNYKELQEAITRAVVDTNPTLDLGVSDKLLTKLFYHSKIRFRSSFIDACYLYISDNKLKRNEYLEKRPIPNSHSDEIATASLIRNPDRKASRSFSIQRVLGLSSLVLLLGITAGYLLTSAFSQKSSTETVLAQSPKAPLQGVWDYNARFSKFHGIDSAYEANGYLIFLWDETDKNYAVHHAYTINKKWDIKNQIITGFGHGTFFDVDVKGYPTSDVFEIKMEYRGRTGQKEFKKTSSTDYSMKNIHFKYSADSTQINLMTGHFKFLTHGTVTTAGEIEIIKN